MYKEIGSTLTPQKRKIPGIRFVKVGVFFMRMWKDLNMNYMNKDGNERFLSYWILFISAIISRELNMGKRGEK